MGDSPPAWLDGAWRRDGRRIGDGPLSEPSRVLWLQVAGYFADIRLPAAAPTGGPLTDLDRAQAFSGVTTYRAPTMVWHHDLDTLGRPPGHHDAATVTLEDAALLERGTNYLEVWRPASPPAGGAAVEMREPDSDALVGRIVVFADRAIIVLSRPRRAGVSLREDGARWQVEDKVGSVPIPWAALSAARTGRASRGWSKLA
jgi:hypothetical protein